MKPLSAFSSSGIVPIRLTALDERVLSCSFGNYPWDEWERRALEKGVVPDLAALGRAVFREAYQHGWDERLQSLCGWRDDGKRMLRLALRSPRTAAKRWQRLMDTDGYRGEYDAQTGEWVLAHGHGAARKKSSIVNPKS